MLANVSRNFKKDVLVAHNFVLVAHKQHFFTQNLHFIGFFCNFAP